MPFELYLITNTVDGKFYVGQTAKNTAWRWKRHLLHAKTGRTTHLCHAIRKHGKESFQIKPLLIVGTQEEADHYETKLIALYKSFSPEYGYNRTVGGEHGTLTNEVKALIGAKNRGRKHPFKKKSPFTAEHRKNIGLGSKKWKRTPEHIKKLRAGLPPKGSKERSQLLHKAWATRKGKSQNLCLFEK